GGADQRDAARARLPRERQDRAGRRRPGDRGRGRRGRTAWSFARRRKRRGPRDTRHDRARHGAGRGADRRTPASEGGWGGGWGLRGPGPPALEDRAHGAAVIRVLLADDQALVRAGFAALLDAQDGIEVVGQAADGAVAVRLVRELNPDVVLMDIRMPGLDGLQATHEIAGDGRLTGVRVVILTTFELDEYVVEA